MRLTLRGCQPLVKRGDMTATLTLQPYPFKYNQQSNTYTHIKRTTVPVDERMNVKNCITKPFLSKFAIELKIYSP